MPSFSVASLTSVRIEAASAWSVQLDDARSASDAANRVTLAASRDDPSPPPAPAAAAPVAGFAAAAASVGGEGAISIPAGAATGRGEASSTGGDAPRAPSSAAVARRRAGALEIEIAVTRMRTPLRRSARSGPDAPTNDAKYRTYRTCDGLWIAWPSEVRRSRKKRTALSASVHSGWPLHSRYAHTITPVRPTPALQ